MATTDDTPKKPATKAAPKRTVAPKKAPAVKAKAAPTAKAAAKPAPKAASTTAKPASKPVRALQGEAQNVFGKVKTGARDAANTGKEKASSTLSDVSAMVEDVAKTLDDKVGGQYGDYARRAADAVSGLADTLKSKEVDELLDDARNFVRQRPAVAIGAAAALGFILTRIVKAGDNDEA